MNRIGPYLEQPSRGFWVPHTPKSFRCLTRRESIRCAIRGLAAAWNQQPNFRLQIYAGMAVIALGFWYHLSLTEWLWVSFAIGLVLYAELMNTAIEQTVDLAVGLRPDPFARYAKDVGAACVLVASILAAVIGGFTFWPYLTGSALG